MTKQITTYSKCIKCGREMTKLYRFAPDCEVPSNEMFVCENQNCWCGLTVDKIDNWSRKDYKIRVRVASEDNLTW